jgi:hypothetical protein
MTKPPSAVLMVKSKLIIPTIAPLRRSTKTRPRLGCSKISRNPRSCLSLSGRKSLSWENNPPSIPDNSSRSASVAGSITTFSFSAISLRVVIPKMLAVGNLANFA